MTLQDIKLTPLLDTLYLEDISDEEYFSKKFSNYISNSRLSLINPEQEGSPDKFFNSKFDGYSESLVLGSLVHCMILQPESYMICESADRPSGKTGYIADLTYSKTGKVPSDEELQEAAAKIDYYGGNLSETRLNTLKNSCINYWRNRALFEQSYTDTKVPLYASNKSKEKANCCLKAVAKDSQIQELLHPTAILQEPIIGNEKTILMDLKVEMPDKDPFILKLKSKLDNFSINFDTETITVNDLKTTGSFIDEFQKSIDKFRYYREMGMYSYLLSLCAKKFYNMENPTINSNFLVVSTVPQYYTRVFPMTKQLFVRGFNEFKNLVRLVAYYVATDSRYSYFASV